MRIFPLMIVLIAFIGIFVISCEARGGGRGGGGRGGGRGGGGRGGGRGGGGRGWGRGGGGGGWHRPNHWGGGSRYSGGGGNSHYHTTNYYGNRYYGGGGGGWGLRRLLFGGLFRRPSYYPNYYNYGNYDQGYCRVAQFVEYVGSTPRYYCDCPPYPPNYQWDQCVPMPAYRKKK